MTDQERYAVLTGLVADLYEQGYLSVKEYYSLQKRLAEEYGFTYAMPQPEGGDM